MTTIGGDSPTIQRNFTEEFSAKLDSSVLDTDTALTANSDSKVATQKAVKAYVDANAGGGVTDHGSLTGLSDDDHIQYALNAPYATAITNFVFLGTEPRGMIYHVSTAAPVTITMPPLLFPEGYEMSFVHNSPNTLSITFDATVNGLIMGSQTMTSTIPNEIITFVKSSASSWRIKNNYIPNSSVVLTGSTDQTIAGLKTFSSTLTAASGVKMGSGAANPIVKTAFFTGTTPSGPNASTTISFSGMTPSITTILGFKAQFDFGGTGNYVDFYSYLEQSSSEFQSSTYASLCYLIGAGGLYVYNGINSNSVVWSRTVKIVVWYV